MQQLSYKIYPSLLDAFVWYKKSEKEECKQELIDKINRVPFQSDAADKGTAFNELIDKCIERGLESLAGENITYEKGESKDGPTQSFTFKAPIVSRFIEELKDAVPQQFVEGVIDTQYGKVLLYGYADEILGDTCIDIKTTKQYEFPKYLHNWQHVVYPYCLNQMGIECNHFTYLITDFNHIFREDYKYEESKVLNRLKSELNDLIFFLEMNRELITNKKIFALDDIQEVLHEELSERVIG